MLLVLCGPSGVGKSTLWLETAEELGFRRYVAYTTRPQRVGEVEGYDYRFLTVERFRRGILQNGFLEWDFFYNHYYGFAQDLRDAVERGEDIVIQALSRIGYRLRRSLVAQVRLVSLQPGNIEILLQRMRERNSGSDEIAYRMHHAYEEQANSFYCDLVIHAAETATRVAAKQALSRAL